MKKVKDMPMTGQFVAVYEYNDQLWSGTYSWDEDGLITEYNLDIDDFEPVGGSGDVYSCPWGNMPNIPVIFYTI